MSGMGQFIGFFVACKRSLVWFRQNFDLKYTWILSVKCSWSQKCGFISLCSFKQGEVLLPKVHSLSLSINWHYFQESLDDQRHLSLRTVSIHQLAIYNSWNTRPKNRLQHYWLLFSINHQKCLFDQIIYVKIHRDQNHLRGHIELSFIIWAQ